MHDIDLASMGLTSLAELLVDADAFPPIQDAAISDALTAPVDGRPISESVEPGKKICIVVSDHTRKTGADRILKALIKQLHHAGCAPRNMYILFASGMHRHPHPPEVVNIIGSDTARHFQDRILLHDPDNEKELVEVGATSRGHRVKLNRFAVEADHLILVGGVVYHYHAGFGGGRKSLVPGLAARATIAHNHSLTLDPDADRIRPGVGPGLLEGNPVAEEMLEAAKLNPPDCCINSVLTPSGSIAGVFAGSMEAAHAAACNLAQDVYRKDVEELADVVIASAGKASNWIQSHKALFNASRAVKPSGTIILEAPCPEGMGNEDFRTWVKMRDPAQICAALRTHPAINGQTALSTVTRGAMAVLVTGMSQRDTDDLGIRTAPDLATALETAVSNGAKTCRLMPDALYTVPFCCEQPNAVISH